METRWIILWVLFLVRTVMGLQFQTVASVSPFLMADLGIDYTSLGFLIGLFHFDDSYRFLTRFYPKPGSTASFRRDANFYSNYNLGIIPDAPGTC
jgi:hypothetical protein